MLDTISDIISGWMREYTPPPEAEIDLESATGDEIDKAISATESDYPAKIMRIQSQIEYLSSNLYHEYEVTLYPPHHEFPNRLREWLLSSPAEDDRKILYELVPRLFFIGRKEIISLYRAAFNGPIARWLIDQNNINILSGTAQNELIKSLKSTWFCPITDSMKISEFYHVNTISGVDLRPDWRTLAELGDPTKIVSYMATQNPPLDRIVLLEDFVGTGSQMGKTVHFAARLTCPILLCPLIISRLGHNRAMELKRIYPNLFFEPALVLDDSVRINGNADEDKDPFIIKLRDLILRTYPLVKGSKPKHDYGPFGYGKEGLLVVLYTNCPDNTLPLIHYESDTPWHPIFPRSSRL
ncbi:MAG: hypothetical protein KJ687_07550 [Proteobacteria bacterium]|nr:hypothetical protein [Pseudomonadota bacterium]